MPTVEFTRTDILRGKVLEPGWYPMEVKSVTEEVSSKGDSTNYVVELEVLSPAHVVGTPLKVYFNEKAKGRMIPFVNACGADVNDKTVSVEKPMAIDIDKCVNKKVQGYVKNETYDGRTINKVEDWRRNS